MANVFSNVGVDFDTINLNRLQVGWVNYNYLDNAYLSVNGTVYADFYEVVYVSNGNLFSSIFAGPSLIRDPSTGAISGTVTGYFESFWNGSAWQTSWGVENANISAAALWNASLTASNSDDLAILQQGLSGADTFNLSSQNNKVYGFDGNDVFHVGAGNDIIDGGAGVDTTVYAGFSTKYLIGPHGQTVDGPGGHDQLTNIEIIQFADGRMVYDQGDAAAVAYRMYDSAFGRAPDSGGLNYWTAALQKGLSAADMATAFAGSQEFVTTYGSLDNEHFVEQLYLNVLDRAGDGGGITYWTNLLNTNALNRGQVLAGFSESTEHVQKLAPVVSAGIWDVNETAASVARLYDATFNRLPDGNGLLYWKDAVDHGTSLSTVAEAFASSAEFKSTYGNLSNEGFVDQIYHNVLHRAGDPGGVAYWTNALASGHVDRGDVLLGFSKSTEHQVNTVGIIDHGIVIA